MSSRSLRSAIEAGVLALVVVLSWQLARVKRAAARMRGEISRNVREFTPHDSLPALWVRNASGDSITLRNICGNGRELIVLLRSDGCRDCRTIADDWATTERLLPHARFVVVTVSDDGGVPSEAVNTRETDVTAAAQSVIAALRVQEVPAVVAADTGCRVLAAGAGLQSSRSVLAFAGRPHP